MLVQSVSLFAFSVWLAVRIINRRERWAIRTAWGLFAALMYVLSFGPACWMAESFAVRLQRASDTVPASARTNVVRRRKLGPDNLRFRVEGQSHRRSGNDKFRPRVPTFAVRGVRIACSLVLAIRQGPSLQEWAVRWCYESGLEVVRPNRGSSMTSPASPPPDSGSPWPWSRCSWRIRSALDRRAGWQHANRGIHLVGLRFSTDIIPYSGLHEMGRA
jgi:hypothetical protein